MLICSAPPSKDSLHFFPRGTALLPASLPWSRTHVLRTPGLTDNRTGGTVHLFSAPHQTNCLSPPPATTEAGWLLAPAFSSSSAPWKIRTVCRFFRQLTVVAILRSGVWISSEKGEGKPGGSEDKRNGLKGGNGRGGLREVKAGKRNKDHSDPLPGGKSGYHLPLPGRCGQIRTEKGI